MTGRGPAIIVRRAVLDDMMAHAREVAPDECCGLLIGHAGTVDRSVRARNARKSPRTYLIDPRDHFAALKVAREQGAAIVGYYHSHPALPPDPSPTDKAEAVPGDHYYLIVTPGEDDVADRVQAFWLIDGNFRPVDLVAVG